MKYPSILMLTTYVQLLWKTVEKQSSKLPNYRYFKFIGQNRLNALSCLSTSFILLFACEWLLFSSSAFCAVFLQPPSYSSSCILPSALLTVIIAYWQVAFFKQAVWIKHWGTSSFTIKTLINIWKSTVFLGRGGGEHFLETIFLAAAFLVVENWLHLYLLSI